MARTYWSEGRTIANILRPLFIIGFFIFFPKLGFITRNLSSVMYLAVFFILLILSALIPDIIGNIWTGYRRNNKKKPNKNIPRKSTTSRSTNQNTPISYNSNNPTRLTMNQIVNMTGEQFEEYLAHVLSFDPNIREVRLTQLVGDFGADLIIIFKNGQRAVVQAKRWKNNVGNGAVQEVRAAMDHYRAHKGIVIATSYFTPAADRQATSSNIELYDRDRLQRWIDRICLGAEQAYQQRRVIRR